MRIRPRTDDVVASFSKLPQQLDRLRRAAADSSLAETGRAAAGSALERARLAAKYGDDSARVKAFDARLSAQSSLIAALGMDAERARLKPPEADEKTFVVMGRVMDAETKAAAGVTVTVTGKGEEKLARATTGARGEFTLKIPGGQNVVIEVLGPKQTVLARSKSINAESGKLLYQEFFLPDKR